MDTTYRHEWKYEINRADLFAIRSRIRTFMTPDPHAENGRYAIRSLYFDTPGDKALREKIDGVDRREKFRIRIYNGDLSFIRMEKKSKRNGLGAKTDALLSVEETEKLIRGDFAWMLAEKDRPLLQELGVKMRCEGLRPKTVVSYMREPFLYAPGNVRVTFDYDIRTGFSPRTFLDPDPVTIPAGDAPILMEVKWDAFLPDIVRDAIWTAGRRVGSFSKYAQCRIYL